MRHRWSTRREKILLLFMFLVKAYPCEIPCGNTTFPEPFCDFKCLDDSLTLNKLQARLIDIDRNNRKVRITGEYSCVGGGLEHVLGTDFELLEKRGLDVLKGCCTFDQGSCSSSCRCNVTCWRQACSGYNITFTSNPHENQTIGIHEAYFTWKSNTSSPAAASEKPPVPNTNLATTGNVTIEPCSQQVCNSTKSCSKHHCSRSCKCRKSKKNIFIIGAIAVAGGVILVLLIFFLAMRRKKMLQSSRYSSCRAHILADTTGAPNPTCFTLKALKIATKSFSESRLLGGGGFSTVYQGKLADGRIVAVKKLNQGNKQAIQQFQNEVVILSKVKHANLVQLLGYCLEGRDLLLVYEYLPNGTLADHLHGDMGEALTLEKRLTIALETAKALAYLHFYVTPPIYHRDVKSSNILLDKNFSVKVADFGLSRLTNIDATNISTAPQGTPGYLDPDYHESYQLTDKSDVYSFGVVLLELISRKKVVDMTRDRKEINLASMALAKIHSGALHELFDPLLSVKYWKILSQVVEVAFRCVAMDKDDRPNMMEVVASLEQISSMVLASGGNSIKSDDSSKTPTLELVASKKNQRSLVTCSDQDSPTSVQIKWPSTHTSPNNSKNEV